MKQLIKNCPETLVILGSGWNRALERTEVEAKYSYQELFGTAASVPGHKGELIIGRIGSTRVAFMSGRYHLYEGYSGAEATEPIAQLANSGVKRLIVTSASGALNPEYEVGDFIVLSDLLTLFLKSNPLIGPKFVDMSQVFSPQLRQLALNSLNELKLSHKEGVYAYVSGPHYETPTDKRALLMLGADCVGMSTVPEALRARELGIEILGLSFITNLAFVKHNHKDVIAAAERSAEAMADLIEKIVN